MFAMDWRIFGSAFATVFLAELGDKTQLTTLSMAAGTGSRWAVFAGSSLALVATTGLAVLAGEAVARLVSPATLRRAAGLAFVALGAWFLLVAPAGGARGSGAPGSAETAGDDAR